MNLVQSECHSDLDIAGFSYDEFATIMMVVFFSIIALVVFRLIAKKGHFRTVLKTALTRSDPQRIYMRPTLSTSPLSPPTIKQRRSSIMDHFTKAHHSEAQNEFIRPQHAARRSLSAFCAEPCSQVAPPRSTVGYRYDYSTEDTSFLRKSFYGSVLSDELLWLQPVAYGCLSAILVGTNRNEFRPFHTL
jgi:hypothetical protein